MSPCSTLPPPGCANAQPCARQRFSTSHGHSFRGVSVYHLNSSFLNEVVAAGLTRNATVYEVEPKVIRPKGARELCPRDLRMGTAYVDAIHGEDHVGFATHMLSYAWFYSVGDIAEALASFCEDNNLLTTRTYVWVCSLCLNQHRVKEKQLAQEVVPFEQFCSEFREHVVGIGHVLALMSPWESPKYFTRVWCIFELFTAISLGQDTCQVTILMPPREEKRFCCALQEEETDVSKVWSALTSFNVENAESSVVNDRKRINRLIEQGPGYKAVNAFVAKYLKSWFVDASERYLRKLQAVGGLDAEHVAGMCAQVGRLLRTVGLYDRAMAVLQEGSEVLTKTDALDGPIHARLLMDIGVIGKKRGNLSEALSAFERAHLARERTGTLDTALGARLMNNIGSAKQACSDLEGAMAAFSKTREILEHVGSMCTRDGAQLLRNMGTIRERQGDSGGALEAYENAQRVLEAAGLLQTPDGARIFNNIGHTKQETGDLAGALGALDRAWVIRERTGTMDTLGGAELLTNYAMLRELGGDVAGARAAKEQADLIYVKLGTHRTLEATMSKTFTDA